MELDTINSIAYENLSKSLDVPSCSTVDKLKSFITIKNTNYIPSKRITIKTKNQSRKIKENCIEPYRGEQLGAHSISLKNIWAFDTKVKSGFVNSSTTYRIDDSFDKITCTSCNGTGEFICDECNGKTKVICYDCGGSGFIKCGHCEGSCKVECRECRGDGRIKCSDCNGKGETRCPDCRYGEIKCPECNGRGKNPNNPDLKCLYCSGKGTIKCPTCHGKGDLTCNTCIGKGTIPCKNCDQTGKVICDYCNGEGRFECTACDDNNMVYCSTCRGNGTLGCAACERQGSLLKYANFTEDIKIYTDVKMLHSKGLPEDLVSSIESKFITLSEKTFDNEPKAIDDGLNNYPQIIKDLSKKIFLKYETGSSRNLQYQIIEEGVDVYQISLIFKERDFTVYIYDSKNLFYANQSDLNFINKELWKDYAENEFNSKNTITAYYAYNYLVKFSHENFPSEENLFKIIKDGITANNRDKLLKQQIKFVDKGCTFDELNDFIENGSKKKGSFFSKKEKKVDDAAVNSESKEIKESRRKEKIKQKNDTENNEPQNISKKSRLLSLILCLFLGFLGIHNFYTGRYKKGILQILLFTSGITVVKYAGSYDWIAGLEYVICFVIAIIDFFAILFGKAKDGNQLFMKKWLK